MHYICTASLNAPTLSSLIPLRLKDHTVFGIRTSLITHGFLHSPCMVPYLTCWDTLNCKMELLHGWTQLKPGLKFLLQLIKKILEAVFTQVLPVKEVLWNFSFLVQTKDLKMCKLLFQKWQDSHQSPLTIVLASISASGSTTQLRCWLIAQTTSLKMDSLLMFFGVILSMPNILNTSCLMKQPFPRLQSWNLIK